MKQIRFIGAVVATVALTAVAGCSTQAGGGEDEFAKLTLVAASSVPSITTEVAVFAVPKALGFFEEEGLDVEMISADGSTAAIQALASGSGDVSFPEGSAVVASAEKGVPVKGFAGIVRTWQWQMAVPPGSDVETISDLKGLKIGVISLASGSYMFAKAALKDAGLDPMEDVEYVPVGFGAPAADAMANGEVDAVALYSTLYEQLAFTGYEFEYLENPPLFDGLPGLVWAAGTDALTESPEIYAAFARAAYKGVVFSLANPEAAVKIAYEEWPDLKPDASSADEQMEADVLALTTEIGSYVDDFADQGTWGNWGEVSEKALASLITYARGGELITKDMNSSEFWDSTIVKLIGDTENARVIKLAESQ